jgi:hypothetical protein
MSPLGRRVPTSKLRPDPASASIVNSHHMELKRQLHQLVIMQVLARQLTSLGLFLLRLLLPL